MRGDDIEPNIEQRIQIIPVLGEYHYVFDLNERISLRGGALLGVSAINLIYTNTGLDPLPDEKKRFEFAVSYGASVGMNVRLTGDIHLDFGYKYIATGKTSFRPHNNTTGVEYKMDSLGGHLFSAALQLRF